MPVTQYDRAKLPRGDVNLLQTEIDAAISPRTVFEGPYWGVNGGIIVYTDDTLTAPQEAALDAAIAAHAGTPTDLIPPDIRENYNYVVIDDSNSPYTPGGEDYIYVDASAGIVQITLQSAAEGKQYWIEVKDGANTVSVEPVGGDSIDGGGSFNLIGTGSGRHIAPSSDTEWHSINIVASQAPRDVFASAVNIALSASDLGRTLLLTAGANATLPDPSVVVLGWWIEIKEAADLNTSDINPFAGENIDTVAGTLNLARLEARTLVTDGTDWWTI